MAKKAAIITAMLFPIEEPSFLVVILIDELAFVVFLLLNFA